MNCYTICVDEIGDYVEKSYTLHLLQIGLYEVIIEFTLFLSAFYKIAPLSFQCAYVYTLTCCPRRFAKAHTPFHSLCSLVVCNLYC